jgi:hypothetical protein
VRGLIAISFSAAIAASPVFGLELVDCDHYRNYSHGWIVDHQDHGNGIISYVQTMLNHPDNSGSRQFSVVACESGEVAWADAAYMPARDATGYDLQEQLSQVLADILEAEETYSMQELADAFSTVSTNSGLGVQQDQSCGCNAAYSSLGNYDQQFEWYELWNLR